MNVNFTRISDIHFLADIEGVTTPNGMVFEVDKKTGLAIPIGLNREVTNQVGEGRDKSQQVLENSPLEQLRQSNHPRASGLINWIESDEENKKWYLENVGTNFDLVQDGISLLGNIWELEDEKMETNPKKGIWNNKIWDNKWYTFFSFDTQKELFGDSIPKRDDWINLTNFLPGSNENIIYFLTTVLGLKHTGYFDGYDGGFKDYGVEAYYWSRTSINSEYAHRMNFNSSNISASFDSGKKDGLSVRRFNVRK